MMLRWVENVALLVAQAALFAASATAGIVLSDLPPTWAAVAVLAAMMAVSLAVWLVAVVWQFLRDRRGGKP